MPADNTASFINTQHAFTRYIRDPDNAPAPSDIEKRRMNIYRDLFYNNISGIISDGFPVLKEITGTEHWENLCYDFLNRHSSSSPYFSKISEEFLQYLQTERSQCPDSKHDYPFMLELAHYEWAELHVSIIEESLINNTIITDPIHQILTVANTALPLAYSYPVHKISPDYIPTEPDEQPTFLVVYRDSNDKVGFLETNPMTHALLETLSNNSSLTCQQILTALADDMQHPNPDIVIQGGASILLDFVRRGIIVSIN